MEHENSEGYREIQTELKGKSDSCFFLQNKALQIVLFCQKQLTCFICHMSKLPRSFEISISFASKIKCCNVNQHAKLQNLFNPQTLDQFLGSMVMHSSLSIAILNKNLK